MSKPEVTHPHRIFLHQLYQTPLFRRSLVENVSAALAEDLGQGDIHEQLYPQNQISKAKVIAREPAVMCGQRWVDQVFRQLSDQVTIQWFKQDGDQVTANDTLFTLEGPTAALLSGERTALNFLQTLMGTATVTAQYQKLLQGTQCQILDTRKTIPGLRLAQKYAVSVGGGVNHRIGLWDAFLIKENHILAAGSIQAAVAKARAFDQKIFIEVEVENLQELQQALAAQVDRVLLDNFSIEELRSAIALRQQLQSTCDFEASGNVTAAAVREIADTGVNYISTGALTKHVQAIDLSFRLYD